MSKIRTLLRGPVLTQSGYGAHAREVFRALYSDPLFDVHVESVRWGNCSYLSEDTEEKRAIRHCAKKYIVAKNKNQENWDLFVTVTIANEFEKRGKFNIGVTAGIETDRVSHVWIQKCNEMDLVIVPSEHSKKVFERTIIDWQNPQTKEKGSFKLTSPIVVCPEGLDVSVFRPFDFHGQETDKISNLNLKTDFNFLHVGQWGKGGYGEDRKNIANLVKYFIEAFNGQKDVGLILKVNMGRNNIEDFEVIKDRLNQIKSNFNKDEVPPIYLLHGNLTDQEMSLLYNHPKVKAFVSLAHGEGFGRPLLEAAACDLPIIATNWSGHLDFLPKGKFSAVDYNMVEIPEVAVWEPILVKGSKWAQAKENDSKKRLQKMVSSYSTPKQWAVELGEKIRENYDINVICTGLSDTIKQFLLSKAESKGLANPVEVLKSEMDTTDCYSVLYTMPRSAGDVFISTAVIDGLMKEIQKQQPDAKLYFATSPQYYDVLKNNPNVYKVIPWRDFMMNVELCEEVYDLVLNPHTQTQYMFSSFVRRGNGRLLAQEYSNYCQSELGDYFVHEEEMQNLPENYMTVHTSSGKDRWLARKYEDWKEIVSNIKSLYPDLKIAQVGNSDEPLLEGVDINLLGKTTVHQLAFTLKNSLLHLGVDSFPMHLATSFNTPTVALFGCSTPTASGPWVKDETKAKYILLESDRRTCGCSKPCYKDAPKNSSVGYANINEIDPKTVFNACEVLLKQYEDK